MEEFPVWKVVSNPPYNIVSPILFKLISLKEKFSSIIIMLQREFAERLTAQPGSKDYSFLTIKMQYHVDIKIIHTFFFQSKLKYFFINSIGSGF